MATGAFPSEGMELTHILVVADAGRSRDFYRDVLGAELYREYGGTSVVLRVFGTWLLLVTGGGPTADKPDVTFAPPTDPRTVAHAMTIRVPGCRAAYETLRGRGGGVPHPAGGVGVGGPLLLPRPRRAPAGAQPVEGGSGRVVASGRGSGPVVRGGGRVRRKAVPPPWPDSAWMVTNMASQRALTMASPRPDPTSRVPR
jgi:catechol 2,3-dioxygenase-like lactoylglutathione lyase family enzyme